MVQGFQPGNKCAGDGSKSQSKGEGKKEDVHSIDSIEQHHGIDHTKSLQVFEGLRFDELFNSSLQSGVLGSSFL